MKKDIKIKDCKKVETFNSDKKPNGWLLEIFSDRDDFMKNIKGQVYLSVVSPGQFKGFHLHALADYFVTCISGKVRHTVYTAKNKKHENEMGDGDFKKVFLPRGCPHAIENVGNTEGYVIIYRYPAWDPQVKEQMDIKKEDINKEKTWKEISKFMKKFKNHGQ